MNPILKKFKVIPSVVEADKESTITIKSVDGIFKFFDNITYEVSIIPQDVSDVPIDDEMSLLGNNKARKTFLLTPQNGEIKVKYYFSGEQEWRIHISTKEYAKHQNPLYEKYSGYWDAHIMAPSRGIDVYVYSLAEDLYTRRALKGDLHIHTNASDGQESPEMVSAYYRKAGHDFIAITDHNLFNTSANAKEKLNFIKNFNIMHGEEVHNGYAGLFHMVNIGGQYSVNDIYINNPEKIEKEVAELAQTTNVPANVDKTEYLNRVWLYNEIKKSGGYAIFVHPYWSIGYFHTSTPMSQAIIRNGLMDAFEVIGGCTPRGNNLQVALYNDLRAEGYDIPVVGSTDSHTVLGESHLIRSTVVFAKDDNILEAVSDGYSVAVESIPGENVRVYGKLRMAFYAHFLLENYYPIHNELCSVSGIFIEEYINGNEDSKHLIEKAEERVLQFEKEFFGA